MAQVVSEFNMYVGISNVTITDGLTPVITAAIPEFNPLDEGCLGEMKIFKCKTDDPLKVSTGTAEVKKVKTVVCTYFGCGDCNQMYPCVHRGERVLVFNYAGTEQYYWRAWGKDPGLRRAERVRWFAMDKPISVDSPPQYQNVTEKNSYFIEMNTNKGDQGVRIHTCTNNGEQWAYDVTIFPEKCMFEITDNMSGGGCKSPVMSCDCDMDKGNCIRLMSNEHRWRIRNVDDSYVELDKENITIWCKDTITMRAGKNIVTYAGENYTSVVGENRRETVGTMSEFTCPEQKVTGDSRQVNMDSYHSLVANGVTQIARNAMSIKSTNIGMSGKMLTYTGKHFFTGPDFYVGTASGAIPVTILLGSNVW